MQLNKNSFPIFDTSGFSGSTISFTPSSGGGYNKKNRIKRGLKIFDKGNLRVSLLMMVKTVFLYDGSFPHK